MADIFISYSKSDHALALKLSIFLESEGWSVWWDTGLGAADLYRDEIMKQLAAARAVITIWSPNSIKSDWVRAEAGRAKADGKLIPLKTADLTYADIPLPFGEMHTEDLASTDLIRAAIVAQLAKPAVQQSAFWQITGTFKYQGLTWIGIVGSVITLFANLNGVLDLADWAKELIAHWQEWTQMFWGWVFSLVKMRMPKPFVPTISFIVSVGILVAGVNLSERTAKSAVELQHSPSVARKVRILWGGALVSLITLVLLVLVIRISSRVTSSDVAVGAVLAIVWIGIPVGYLLYFGKERFSIVVNSLLFVIMSYFLLYLPANYLPYVDSDAGFEIIDGVAIIFLFPICWMAVILFSPVQQLTRRLAFVVLGVLILIALSEISKLNLHQYLRTVSMQTQSPKIVFGPSRPTLATPLLGATQTSASQRET
jgi:hypothetical protein